MANEKENETEYEFQPLPDQEMKKISDKNLAILFCAIGAVVMVICPLVIPGLIGWALSVMGLIFVILGICGFVSVSQEAKRIRNKD
ncbi:MAG: hypothetical protein ILP17_03690 [Lachnospiraceae bacterium]|nr:hypothetical protein [Lachnospiraceae bacterium]